MPAPARCPEQLKGVSPVTKTNFEMAKLIQYRRLVCLAILLSAGFLALGYRMVDLQWLQSRELRQQALRQTQRTLPRAPRRGDIRDAHGNLLATSLFVKTVCADPSIIRSRARELARVLSPLRT